MSKLTTLNKKENMSLWYKAQIKNNHENPSFFISHSQPPNPWDQEREQCRKISEHIPALKSMNFGARYRCNKDVNQTIKHEQFTNRNNQHQ